MLPTIAFTLISFFNIKATSLTNAIIPRSELQNRILFVKTNKGNFAKLQVKSGPALYITDLVVYDSTGVIIKTGTDLSVAASYYFDIDNAVQTASTPEADLWWHALTSSNSQLEPKNGALFSMSTDFDDITFANVSVGVYKNIRVDREWLRNQIVYCKTSEGRFAKLRVEAGNDLLVRKMVVYNANGTVYLTATNLTVPPTGTLDIDNATVGTGVRDLWWQAVSSTYFLLTPMNGATFSFESYAAYEKYLPLLKDTAIKSSMVISGTTNRNYDQWVDAEKLQLREFIYSLETSQPLPISGPPVVNTNGFMANGDALKIYMSHVAQSLWVDATNKVSWHLAGATAAHLEHLFDMRKLYAFSSSQGYGFSFQVMGNVTDWSPTFTYQFLQSNGLIKSTQWETIKAVVDWGRAHLTHIFSFTTALNGGPFASQDDQWDYLFGYRGLPPVDKMLVPLPGKPYTTHGCWGTDGFLAALLRTVNIPVKHGRSNFSGALHSRAEFFTVGKNLRHGDDVYNGWMRLGHNNVPVDRLFMTDAQLHDLIDAPAPLPGKTVPETASFNHAKFYIDLAIEFKTDYLLDYRCADRSSGIFTGSGSQLWSQLHEYYTDTQIAAIGADCDTAIAAIAGGCSAL